MTGFLTEYADLLLAALTLGVVAVIVVQMRRLDLRPSLPAAALLVYLVLRSMDRLVDAPQFPIQAESTTERVIDALSILVLVYLVTQAGRIIDAFQAIQHRARIREEAYERARRHYTQVVRHRVMNPLTVITGTLLTVRDGVLLDDVQRRELCGAALAAVDELTTLTLLPERRDDLERDLHAIPDLPEPGDD